MSSTTSGRGSPNARNAFIRGVNIGGWLLLEPFITPYMFALTDCHVQGNFCFFPKQISAPRVGSSEHEYCDMYQCHFLLGDDGEFVAKDEYTLASQFDHKSVARTYLSYHWDNFVTKKDVELLNDAGVTHVRVPMPHWIMGDIHNDEPWVDGQWLYFVRFVGWCRELGIQVWPDIHTAPGSQNGFDNSGQLLDDAPTCRHWSSSPENVKRSLRAVKDISEAVVRDNLEDVVTGFGVLNEPFSDCDVKVVKQFYNEALMVVRNTIGEDTAVYIGDMFNATEWNNGWWIDEDAFSNTFLDSHYYHCFDGNDRKLSPKQHIALVCGKDTRATQSCCYQDTPKNTIPSRGISRLVGEWSAAYDSEPEYRMNDIMNEIRKKKGDTANFDLPSNRTLNKERHSFLKQFVQAQMVSYESAGKDQSVGISHGWFFWTLKMEFGSLGEWDFLRGYQEGWIPTLPRPTESSESLFGSCHDIAEDTRDDSTVVNEYPNPATHPGLWSGPSVDDDFVLSHAGSLGRTSNTKVDTSRPSEDYRTSSATKAVPHAPSSSTSSKATTASDTMDVEPQRQALAWFPLFCVVFFVYGVWKVFLGGNVSHVQNRRQYSNLDDPIRLTV